MAAAVLLYFAEPHPRLPAASRGAQPRHEFFGGQRDAEDDPPDPIEAAADPAGRDPSEHLAQGEAMQALETALECLPARQREAFVLRILEGLDVADTAKAMGCSEGSVKTHLSRAVHSLRETLGEHWA